MSIILACILCLGDPILVDQWQLQPRRSVVVALIDSGMDLTHEDLAGNLWVNPGEIPGNGIDDDGNGYVDDVHGWDFADADADPTDPCYGHGTTTAGVLGAVSNNEVGIAGAADHVQFMVLRVLGCNGTGTEQRLIDAIEYAANNNAQVIQAVVFVSEAWGIAGWDQPGSFPDLNDAIDNSGLLFVCPSGNEGISLDPPNYRYPPSCVSPNKIVVTASNQADTLASTASYGQLVDLAAPGTDIWTTAQLAGHPLWTDPTGYKSVDGSSFSVPQVVAVAARLLWMNPSLTTPVLKSRVLEHVEIKPEFADTSTGGRLSAFFTSVPPPPPPPPPVPGSGPVLHLTLDDGTGADESGTGNTMTCSSCPSLVPGLTSVGNATDFSNDWFQRQDGSLLGDFPSAGATEFTIAAWIQIDAVVDRQPIASKQGAGERGWMFLVSPFNGGRLRFESWPIGATSASLVDGVTIVDSGVHHVAVTRTADGTVTLYLDGVEEASLSVGPPRDNGQPLDVGRYSWNSYYTRYFDGVLDDVRFYDRGIDALEIEAIALP